MGELADMIRDIAALFFPPHCPVCGEALARGERAVCTLCRATAPLTGFAREADNPVVRKFWGQLPLAQASGFLYFNHHSGWRDLIHGFKYRGAWRLAREMGEWYGAALKESDLYADVDVVVPLPLHPLKRCRRGYNQSEYIARGIAAQLGVPVDRRSVRRKRNTASQALKPRRERARNVEEAFAVRHPERLAGRHILLVDDVLTTGSTLMACAGEILRAAPTCRVSVAALAVSQRELGGERITTRSIPRQRFFHRKQEVFDTRFTVCFRGWRDALCYKHSFRQKVRSGSFDISARIVTFEVRNNP